MVWRVISREGEVWHVHRAVERRANQSQWQLVLSFRAAETTQERKNFWAPYPLESTSKSSLYTQAEKIPDDALHDLLCQHCP